MSISLQEFQRRYDAIRKVIDEKRIDSLLIFGLNDDFNRGNTMPVFSKNRVATDVEWVTHT